MNNNDKKVVCKKKTVIPKKLEKQSSKCSITNSIKITYEKVVCEKKAVTPKKHEKENYTCSSDTCSSVDTIENVQKIRKIIITPKNLERVKIPTASRSNFACEERMEKTRISKFRKLIDRSPVKKQEKLLRIFYKVKEEKKKNRNYRYIYYNKSDGQYFVL